MSSDYYERTRDDPPDCVACGGTAFGTFCDRPECVEIRDRWDASGRRGFLGVFVRAALKERWDRKENAPCNT